ncbi:hypothetical protein PLICRDRAFT_36393 [Plicaturopsis crispa FD-325 SS-3]|nr:hypothetical protein PLICRDRAFT_36393 [Plicaturopsis crispa FD-325 SS-3]
MPLYMPSATDIQSLRRATYPNLSLPNTLPPPDSPSLYSTSSQTDMFLARDAIDMHAVREAVKDAMREASKEMEQREAFRFESDARWNAVASARPGMSRTTTGMTGMTMGGMDGDAGVASAIERLERQFKRTQAMLTNERRRRFNERKQDLDSARAHAHGQVPGSGFTLAARILGVEPRFLSSEVAFDFPPDIISPSTSVPGSPLSPSRRPSCIPQVPQVGDEFPEDQYPKNIGRLTLQELGRLMCFYNEDFGIMRDDWGHEAIARRYVEWMRI